MQTIQSKTIVFITGAFVGNNCWDEWKLYFENKGYKTITPAVAAQRCVARRIEKPTARRRNCVYTPCRTHFLF